MALATSTANLTPDQYLPNLSGAGNVALNTGNLIVGYDNSSTTFGGTISGIGALTKYGSGMLTLANSNSYSGMTTAVSGTLSLAHRLAVENSTVNVVNNNTLAFAAGNTTPVFGGLTVLRTSRWRRPPPNLLRRTWATTARTQPIRVF